MDSIVLIALDSTCFPKIIGKNWIEFGHKPFRQLGKIKGWKRRGFYNIFLDLPSANQQYPLYEVDGNKKSTSYQVSPSERYYFQVDTSYQIQTVKVIIDSCEYYLRTYSDPAQ